MRRICICLPFFIFAYDAISTAGTYKPTLNIGNYHAHHHDHSISHSQTHSHAMNQEETEGIESNKQSK